MWHSQAAVIILLILTWKIDDSSHFRLRKGCDIALSNSSRTPLLISLETSEFVYPKPKNNKILLETGETVLISCPGSELSTDGKRFSTSEAICISDEYFLVANEIITLTDLQCQKKPQHSAKFTNKSCNSGRGTEIEIGHQLSPNKFILQITICFDSYQQVAFYTQHNITKFIESYKRGVKRPSFIQGSFYQFESQKYLNRLYSRATQRKTFNQLVGLLENSTKFIKNSDYFLSRGHLTPKVDFVYSSQQLATFYYVNAAPQWQIINGGNWNRLEKDVRTYVIKNHVDLVIYTGTYGVSTLSNEETGEETQIFLYIDENQNQLLPVPELFWKVVYNPASKKGVVIITINNPYQTDVERSILCKDVLTNISWLSWKNYRTNKKYGYTYACSVSDFRETVSYLPQIHVNGLLL